MEMSTGEVVNEFLFAIESLELFRSEVHQDLFELIASSCVDVDYSYDRYELDASVDIEKTLDDVDSVKYKSYHFAITQIENKIKELTEQISLF